MSAEFHLAENALALQLFLKRLESLVNVVVANENLQAVVSSEENLSLKCAKTPTPEVWPPVSALDLVRLVSKTIEIGNRLDGNSARGWCPPPHDTANGRNRVDLPALQLKLQPKFHMGLESSHQERPRRALP
jgi:hypothetical protein